MERISSKSKRVPTPPGMFRLAVTGCIVLALITLSVIGHMYQNIELAVKATTAHWYSDLLLGIGTLISGWAAFLLFILHVNRSRRQEELELQISERTRSLVDTSHDLAVNQARLQALLEISRFQAQDTQQLLDFALEKVMQITASQFGYIYHYHEDRQEFVLNSWSKEVMPSCIVANPQTIYQLEKTGIWGEAVRQRQPILVNDFAAEHPLKKGYPEGHIHLTRFLTVPVFDDKQQIVAVVGVANKELPYTDEDVQQLDLMISEVWQIVKRLELELKLIHASHEWQSTFDAISDSICLLNVDQRVLRCNRASLQLFKHDFTDIIGRHCWQLVHDTDAPPVNCPMLRAQRSRTTENQLFFENGRWLQVTVDPLLDDQGELSGAVHIVRDVTMRIAAEESRRELLSMLEAVQNELYVFNIDTLQFEYVNASAQRNLGYNMELLLQMSPCDLQPYSRVEFVRLIAPLMAAETSLLRFETTHRRVDGSSYPIEANLQLVESQSGKRCLAVIHDISARMQTEEHLQEALQQAQSFRIALDYVNAFIYIKDLESRYVYANKPCLELFGCTAEELPGSPDSRFFPLEAVERLHWIDQQVFRGERTTEEVQIPLPDGDCRTYLELKTPIFADSDNELITGLLGISSDITELKKAEQQLHELHAQLLQNEKMASIGQLSAGIAHEINNPMGFINSNLATLGKYIEKFDSYIRLLEELVQHDTDGESWQTAAAVKRNLKLEYVLRDVPQLIQESSEGAERVMKIVQDLKTFSRSDTSQTCRADINQNLDSTINIIWNQLKYVAELVRDYGVLPKLPCNIQQLNQVFLNLLVNAAHAIEDKGLEEIGIVTVKTRADDESVYISVSDTGCGIPEEIRRRIFEPFFTTKEIGKGTGLGLSISYDIIRKHGGELSVTSEVGQGTTFTIRLPLQGEADGTHTDR